MQALKIGQVNCRPRGASTPDPQPPLTAPLPASLTVSETRKHIHTHKYERYNSKRHETRITNKTKTGIITDVGY